MEQLVCFIGIWVICGFVGSSIANNRGNSGGSGFLLGLFLGPLGVLIVAVSAKNERELMRRRKEIEDEFNADR